VRVRAQEVHRLERRLESRILFGGATAASAFAAHLFCSLIRADIPGRPLPAGLRRKRVRYYAKFPLRLQANRRYDILTP
jgi:hypothetical protein